ncbi:MAG: 5-(carboxyamino)imidazole ribonucleotide mutase [Planctomycetota bacterium]|jgi:phosphoribosylaminoimidazole carboxylase PurE protein
MAKKAIKKKVKKTAKKKAKKKASKAVKKAAKAEATVKSTRRVGKEIVGVVMGSDSDLHIVERCLKQLAEFGISFEVRVISAHRTPDAARDYAVGAADRGLKVLIAAAGMSAALSGVLSAHTILPVIGIPIASGPLIGVDAALSTMQMPPGIPVGCMAIGAAGAINAAIFAAEILGVDDPALAKKLVAFKKQNATKTKMKDAAIRKRTKRR